MVLRSLSLKDCLSSNEEKRIGISLTEIEERAQELRPIVAFFARYSVNSIQLSRTHARARAHTHTRTHTHTHTHTHSCTLIHGYSKGIFIQARVSFSDPPFPISFFPLLSFYSRTSPRNSTTNSSIILSLMCPYKRTRIYTNYIYVCVVQEHFGTDSPYVHSVPAFGTRFSAREGREE